MPVTITSQFTLRPQRLSQDIFLGIRDCQGYIQPCDFVAGGSNYDSYGAMSYGIMFHSLAIGMKQERNSTSTERKKERKTYILNLEQHLGSARTG